MGARAAFGKKLLIAPGRIFEHLPGMPIQVGGMGQVLFGLRQDQPGTMVRQHAVGRRLAAVKVLAENHLVCPGQDFECTQVKHLVVHPKLHIIGYTANSDSPPTNCFHTEFMYTITVYM